MFEVNEGELRLRGSWDGESGCQKTEKAREPPTLTGKTVPSSDQFRKNLESGPKNYLLPVL